MESAVQSSLGLAYSFIEQGEYDRALFILEELQSSYDFESKEDFCNTLIQFYRAQALDGKSYGLQAVEAIREAVDILHHTLQTNEDVKSRIDQDPQVPLGIYYQASVIEYKWGDQVKALEWTEEMYKIYKRPSLHSLRNNDKRYGLMLGDMGSLAFNLGFYGIGRKYLQEALEIFSKQRDSANQAKTLVNLALLENTFGNRSATIRFLQKLQELGQADNTSEIYFLLATLSYEDGNFEQCQELIEKITEDIGSPETGDLDLVVPTILLRAKMLRGIERKDEAFSLLTSLLEIVTKRDIGANWLVQTQLDLALLLGERGELTMAVKYAEIALNIAKQRGFKSFYQKAASIIGGIYYILEKYEEAFKVISELTDFSESNISMFGLGYGESIKIGENHFEHLINMPIIAANHGKNQESIIAMEHLRYQADAEFYRMRIQLNNPGVYSNIYREYKGIQMGIDFLDSMRNDNTVFTTEEYKNIIAVLEQGIKARFDELSRSTVNIKNEFASRNIITSLNNIEQGTAIVYVFPGAGQLLIAVANATGILIPEILIKTSEVEDLVSQFYFDIREIGFRARDILLKLSKAIWFPITKVINQAKIHISKLYIIPFGWGHILPLHLLIDYQNNEFLFEKLNVVYTTTICHSKQPVFTQSDDATKSILFVSPFPSELTGAKAELNAIKSTKLTVDLLGGLDCNRHKLFETLATKKYDFIHFACHGVANYESSSLSYLELSEGQRCYIADLLQYCDCKGATVVLSACNTAMATVSKVDLKNSLADAFRFSGATAILASQWPTEDIATAIFMNHFYEAISLRESVETAFAQALKFLSKEMRSEGLNLRYWGAFTLTLA
jgi:CHAT domain-containing protein